MKFLVLGGGAQGSAAAFELVRRDEVEAVVIADRVVEKVRPFLKPYLGGKLSMVEVDASDPATIRPLMEVADAVVCGLPYFFGFPMARLAVECEAHYCDLGGNTEIVERQKTLDDEAQRAGVSVIPDCGLAPGMVNILAQAGIDAMDEVESVRIWVGGLPQHPKPPLNYQIVYSMQGVLDYYTTTSIVLRDGEVTEVAALSEVETLAVDGVGELEAFHTAGGISSMPYRYQGVIPTMEYKTLRYPGHAHVMKAIRGLGLISDAPVAHEGHEIVPRDFFIDIVSPKLRNPDGDDLVALRVRVDGTSEGSPASVQYDLVDRYDEDNRITAMMRTTGYSLAITSLMQVDGRVDRVGAFTPDEVMPASAYIEELAGHGIDIVETRPSP